MAAVILPPPAATSVRALGASPPIRLRDLVAGHNYILMDPIPGMPQYDGLAQRAHEVVDNPIQVNNNYIVTFYGIPGFDHNTRMDSIELPNRENTEFIEVFNGGRRVKKRKQIRKQTRKMAKRKQRKNKTRTY